MNKPMFNHVLVEIDDKDAKWGKGNDDNIGGEVFHEGTLVDIADMFVPFGDTETLLGNDLETIQASVKALVGKHITWNEGHEAGTVFEEDGKKYAYIYWWDLVSADV